MGLELIRVNPDGEKVQFRPDAAASFRRMEVQQRRDLDVNRTVVTWNEQNDLFQLRLRGQYPYSVAHPDKSDHVYRSDTDGGNAWDTDERGAWLEENGWIADVEGEPWHRRYVPSRDKYRNTPTPAAVQALNMSQEDDMPINFRNPANGGITYTMVPGFSITAHINAFGSRLTNYVNTGIWPASESDQDRFNAGLRNLNSDHVSWMLGFYGFGRFNANTLPRAGTVYSDVVQAQIDALKTLTDRT